MKASKFSTVVCTTIVCIIGGAGCFRKSVPYTQSPPQQEVIDVQPNSEGAKASTGGIQATVTPSLDSQLLAGILPDDKSLEGYSSTVAEEQKNPVPLQDGTRADFLTMTKTFERSDENRFYSIRASLTDTRSIPVLTAFLNSYSEYSNELGVRKKLSIQGESAWLTYRMGGSDPESGFGSIIMLYRNRFLIQIDGNMGVRQKILESILNAYHFDQMK